MQRANSPRASKDIKSQFADMCLVVNELYAFGDLILVYGAIALSDERMAMDVEHNVPNPMQLWGVARHQPNNIT